MSPQKKSLGRIKISIHELPSLYVIKNVNYRLLNEAKRGLTNKDGEPMIYETWGKTFDDTKKIILNPSPDCQKKFIDIRKHFPVRAYIFSQCAYYFRAFSKCQLFPDGNHRTGYFSLLQIMKKKNLRLKAGLVEINQLSVYLKNMGIMECDINVNLIEKDEVYKYLREWFEQELDFR